MKLALVLMCAPLLLLNACVVLNTATDTAGSSAHQNTPAGNNSTVPRTAPVFKPYTGADGGYVAVYTRDREHAAYSVGDGIYVAALIRVQGRYIGRIFYPTGYGPGDDITHDAAILELCDEYLPELKGEDWIGGDTGGDYFFPDHRLLPGCSKNELQERGSCSLSTLWRSAALQLPLACAHSGRRVRR